jgi:hypothetical protein
MQDYVVSISNLRELSLFLDNGAIEKFRNRS